MTGRSSDPLFTTVRTGIAGSGIGGRGARYGLLLEAHSIVLSQYADHGSKRSQETGDRFDQIAFFVVHHDCTAAVARVIRIGH